MPGPTQAPADWLTVYFQWSYEVFFWANYSPTRLRASRISFEALDGSGSFSGGRWSQFGSNIFPNGCMRLDEAGTSTNPSRPAQCNQINASIATSSGEIFWRSDFRVLWDGVPVAECQAASGACAAFVPPN
jgi:hypothetical protein